MKRIWITTFVIALFLVAGTTTAILYARGYQLFGPSVTKGNFIAGTGLLVLTSKPDGAKVFIDDHLTTATNNTINLPPGEYSVRIAKDGYFSWNKKIRIEKEIVSKAEALLFPVAPKLESITITGASNPVMDSNNTLLAFTTASSSAEKNGVYVLDMNSRPILSLGGGTTQIANNTTNNFSEAELSFSPNSTELLATISANLSKSTYVLNPSSFNQTPKDITTTLFSIDASWKKQKSDKQDKFIASLPKKSLQKMVTTYFKNPIPSLDQDKIFYTASSSATLPAIITPKIIGTNSYPEVRNITEGNLYVYDIKEDRNYIIQDKKSDSTETFYLWHPDSNHIIFVKDKKINVMDFDGSNATVVYAGPFVDSYVFPWPDGSSIVILTNLNLPQTPNNLYRLMLK